MQHTPLNFKAAIAEIYPRIPWKLLADRLRSEEHTRGNYQLLYFNQAVTARNVSLLCSANCG